MELVTPARQGLSPFTILSISGDQRIALCLVANQGYPTIPYPFDLWQNGSRVHAHEPGGNEADFQPDPALGHCRDRAGNFIQQLLVFGGKALAVFGYELHRWPDKDNDKSRFLRHGRQAIILEGVVDQFLL